MTTTEIPTIEEMRARDWPEIEAGERYEFYAEMQEEYRPFEERMNRYTGQLVRVIRSIRGADDPNPESDWFPPTENEEPEVSRAWLVRTWDGREFFAMEEELTGWDKALGQFFGPSGVYGDPS